MATDFFFAAKFSFLSSDNGITQHLLSNPLWTEIKKYKYLKKNALMFPVTAHLEVKATGWRQKGKKKDPLKKKGRTMLRNIHY